MHWEAKTHAALEIFRDKSSPTRLGGALNPEMQNFLKSRRSMSLISLAGNWNCNWAAQTFDVARLAVGGLE
jgi:hypothetical protein